MSDVSRLKLTAIIEDLCEQAGCNKEQRVKHRKQFLHRWNPHPSMRFRAWWEPSERDSISGADVGGHPEARRQWSQKHPDGYVHNWYGTGAEAAYNCAPYREEYEAWILAGRPEKPVPFVSICATPQEVQKFWHDLKDVVANIDKKMPKVSKGDVALEETSPKTMPDP